jgi:tetratricopeptide (TPR) repeat protein
MPLGDDQTIGFDMSQKLEALLQQARADRAAGRMAEARAAYELAVAKARAIDDRTLLAQALRHVSDMERERGKSDEAFMTGQEAVDIYRQLPDASQLDLANALRVTALALMDLGKPLEALPVLQEARALYRELQISEGVAECDSYLSHMV